MCTEARIFREIEDSFSPNWHILFFNYLCRGYTDARRLLRDDDALVCCVVNILDLRTVDCECAVVRIHENKMQSIFFFCILQMIRMSNFILYLF